MTHTSDPDGSGSFLQHTSTQDTSEAALQAAMTDTGLTAIDLYAVAKLLAPLHVPPVVLEVLASAMSQVISIGASLEAVRAGFYAMQAARDEALDGLAQVQGTQAGLIRQRDAAEERLKELEYSLEILNADDPRVRSAMEQVWEAAQADLIERMNARKGA